MANDRKENNTTGSKRKGFPCIYFEGLDACTCNNDPDDPGECVYEKGIEPEKPAAKCKHYQVRQMCFDGITIDRMQLYTQQEVLSILKQGNGSDRDLALIRQEYDKRFGNELIWRYPLMVGDDLGAVLIPVREGFLSIGYNEMSPEEYEIFNLDAVILLSADEIQQMKDDWNSYARGLRTALESMWQIQIMREKK